MPQSLAVMTAPAIPAHESGRSALTTLGDFWCRTMHNDVTWPVRGQYHCKVCWRTYDVPFERTGGHSAASARQAAA